MRKYLSIMLVIAVMFMLNTVAFAEGNEQASEEIRTISATADAPVVGEDIEIGPGEVKIVSVEEDAVNPAEAPDAQVTEDGEASPANDGSSDEFAEDINATPGEGKDAPVSNEDEIEEPVTVMPVSDTNPEKATETDSGPDYVLIICAVAAIALTGIYFLLKRKKS